MRNRFLCPGCSRWIEQHTRRNKVCWPCEKYKKEHGHWPCDAPPSPPPSSPSPPPSPTPLFEHDASSHSHLTPIERAAIVTLSKLHMDQSHIAELLPCHRHTVGHWEKVWRDTHSVEERQGRGRKRKGEEYTDAIVDAAKSDPHRSTPKQLRRQLQLPLSARTIRRRLNEHGLFGCVTRHEYPFTDRLLTKRMSWDAGYANWTNDTRRDVTITPLSVLSRLGTPDHGQAYTNETGNAKANPANTSTSHHTTPPQHLQSE